MRAIKILLVAGMALYLTLAALGDIAMPQSAFRSVAAAVGMQGTAQQAMWRAIEDPILVWLVLGLIVLLELVGAGLCWVGAARMWATRRSSTPFTVAKRTAQLGLGVTACLYFIGYLAIAQEYFMMWQNVEIDVLPDAFRMFASAALISLWLSVDD